MYNAIRAVPRRLLGELQSALYARRQSRFQQDLSFTEAARKFPSRNDLHAYMHHYFYRLCPQEVQRHREYYKIDQRGFGEDAFHAMWFTLLREFRPKRCLEIGIYRGQVITLWALIARNLGFDCEVHGISPFSALGDEVSVYRETIDYEAEVLNHHRHFGLPAPILVRALSSAQAAVEHINSVAWDLIYIDGNHAYEVVMQDYELCKRNLRVGGLLVLDDSSLNTDFDAPLFSFAGHPGPSQVMGERAMRELDFVGGVGHNNIFMKRGNDGAATSRAAAG